MTAHHVLDDSDGPIDVYVEGSGTHRAALEGFDESIDFAVLSICCAEFVHLTGAEFGGWEGSWAIMLSRPSLEDTDLSYAMGKVTGREDYSDGTLIWFDATLKGSGASGSPLLDIHGRVVGLAIGQQKMEPYLFAALDYGSASDHAESWAKGVKITE